MSAAQQLGRVCACGCGQSLEGLHRGNKYSKPCADRIQSERKAQYQRNRSTAQRRSETDRAKERKRAPNPHQNIVRSDRSDRTRVKFCMVCCGMPWARHPDRFTDGQAGELVSVIASNGSCRGCGEAWSPEPKPEAMNVITSSAGIAVIEGRLEGYEFQPRGRGKKKASK